MADGFISLSVMVKDYHCGRHGQDILAFCIAGTIGIHHDHCRIAVHDLTRLSAANDEPCLRAVHFIELVQHGTHRRGHVVYHNICLLVQRLRRPVDPHRRSEGICIRKPVSHNDHLVLGLYDLPKRLGLDSCLDSGVLLHLLRLSAVIGDLLLRLHHRLVSAPCQGQIHGAAGIFHTVHVRAAAGTDADTQSDGHLITDIDRLDVLQKIKLVLPDL